MGDPLDIPLWNLTKCADALMAEFDKDGGINATGLMARLPMYSPNEMAAALDFMKRLGIRYDLAPKLKGGTQK